MLGYSCTNLCETGHEIPEFCKKCDQSFGLNAYTCLSLKLSYAKTWKPQKIWMDILYEKTGY